MRSRAHLSKRSLSLSHVHISHEMSVKEGREGKKAMWKRRALTYHRKPPHVGSPELGKAHVSGRGYEYLD
jgi:hypothetical protein